MGSTHLESSPEAIEKGPDKLKGLKWIVLCVEFESPSSSESSESPIEETQKCDVPQDDYLERELEPGEQEELAQMLSKRIPLY